MKKIVFFISCVLLLVGCDFLPSMEDSRTEEGSTYFIVECDSLASVTPSEITVPRDSTVIFVVTMLEKDCYIDQITVDGKNIIVPSDNKFSVVASTPDCKIKVICKRGVVIKKKFIISAFAEEGGTISPSGISSIEERDSIIFFFNSNAGFEIKEIKVNGVIVPNASSYTFTPDRDSSTILVSFNKTQLELLKQKPWKNVLLQARNVGTSTWFVDTCPVVFHTMFSFYKNYRFEQFYENGKMFGDGPYVLIKDSLLVGVHKQEQLGGIRNKIITLTEDSLILINVARYIGPEETRIPDTEFKETYTH